MSVMGWSRSALRLTPRPLRRPHIVFLTGRNARSQARSWWARATGVSWKRCPPRSCRPLARRPPSSAPQPLPPPQPPPAAGTPLFCRRSRQLSRRAAAAANCPAGSGARSPSATGERHDILGHHSRLLFLPAISDNYPAVAFLKGPLKLCMRVCSPTNACHPTQSLLGHDSLSSTISPSVTAAEMGTSEQHKLGLPGGQQACGLLSCTGCGVRKQGEDGWCPAVHAASGGCRAHGPGGKVIRCHLPTAPVEPPA